MILSSVCHFISFYRLKALALFALGHQYHVVLSSKKCELFLEQLQSTVCTSICLCASNAALSP